MSRRENSGENESKNSDFAMEDQNSADSDRKMWILISSLPILFIGMMTLNFVPLAKKNVELCTNEECVNAGKLINSTMEPTGTIDPCDDFYRYACGGYYHPDTHVIFDNAELSFWSERLEEKSDSNDKIIEKMLEANIDTNNAKTASSKAKLYYQTCVEHERKYRQEVGNNYLGNCGGFLSRNTKNFMSDLIKKAGGSHMMKNFNKSITFEERVQRIQIYSGIPLFFDWSIREQDNEKYLTVFKGREERSKGMFGNSNSKEDPEPTKCILQFLNDFGSDINDKLDNIDTFEDELRRTYGIDRNFATFKISELSKKFPFLNWKIFFDHAFVEIGITSPITQNTEVLVEGNFLQNINKLLKEQGEEVLENYMIFKLVQRYKSGLCLSQTENIFHQPIFQMFMNENQGAQKMTTEMVNSIRRVFHKQIDSIEWMMDSESRQNAKTKLENMKYSSDHGILKVDDNWLDNEYKDLEIGNRSHLLNKLRSRIFSHSLNAKNYLNPDLNGTIIGRNRLMRVAEQSVFISGTVKEYKLTLNPKVLSTGENIKNLHKNGPLNIDEDGNVSFKQDGIFLSAMGPFYNRLDNSITIPIGTLQPPLFWSNPKSLMYGGIGFFIAHEMTHGFDDQGMMFNLYENGEDFLYTNSTIEAFKTSMIHLIQQYSAYDIDGMKIDGNLTLTENIADHGGLHFAEMAYENWLSNNNWSDATLQGFQHLSPQQLFYLGFATPWCERHGKQTQERLIQMDTHSPNRFRVNGPLSNSVKFSEAWSCKPGSSMNPHEKSFIWGK